MNSRRKHARLLRVLGAFVLAGAVLAGPIPAASARAGGTLGPCGSWQGFDVGIELTGSSGPNVAARSSSDVWIVGETPGPTGYQIPAAAHWDGSTWKQTSPALPPGSGHGGFESVVAFSANNVWATGYIYPLTGGSLPLAEHWNGSAWAVVPTPAFAVQDGLASVAGSSGSDLWAVGVREPSFTALVLHWDGSAWTAVPAPAPGIWSELDGVTAALPTDAVAVGTYSDGTNIHPLILHWDGSTWSKTGDRRVDGLLRSVQSLSPTDAWAVGDDYEAGDAALIEHWDGTAWSKVDPGISTASRPLFGVSAVSSNDVWATGAYFSDHWDGHTWSAADSSTALVRVAALDDEVWASGGDQQAAHLCPVSVTDTGFSTDLVTTAQASGAFWRISSGATGPHQLTDGTGLGLFDSGSLAPGAWFSFEFPAAGTYSVADAPSASTCSVSVPIQVAQTPNKAGKYAVTWAVGTPPSNLVFDVQVMRPGAATFVDWKHGVTSLRGKFLPDAGPGVYTFRSRARDPIAHARSRWSPSGSFSVS